ncbi:MAG TPA: RNA polymerase sigma factor [Solirubrobacteraceae bacterium]|nr:RNA polymerase sigma factor [Solirubrobacteraceae bacterium]
MDGEQEALFEAHFRSFAGDVYAYALRRSSADVAQDVTAQTFLIAWRRRAQAPSEPLPWLYGIARGVLANERRSARRRGALVGRIAAEPAPALASATSVEAREVLAAVARLSSRDSEALLLTAWEGLSTREAAIVLGCSAPALAVRLHRARRRLARELIESGARVEPAGCAHPLSELSA